MPVKDWNRPFTISANTTVNDRNYKQRDAEQSALMHGPVPSPDRKGGKMEFDFSLLRGKIREKGMTQAQLAKDIGISATALNLKLNNKSDFTLRETFAIAKRLGIEDCDPFFYAVRLP